VNQESEFKVLQRSGAQRKAVFIDRDGTINVEKEYLHSPDDFEFIPGVPEAIRILHDAGYVLVVVTNQSGIARGYYGEDDVRKLHQYMDSLLSKEGASIDAYYFCPHHPESGMESYRIECECRKPLPGMLLQAASDLNIDLSVSWMVGDKLADVEAGIAAGCTPALVLTGYGAEEKKNIPSEIRFFTDLLAAARAIIS